MNDSRNVWHEWRDWYAQLSPGARWGYGLGAVGLVLVLLSLLAQTVGPSSSAPYGGYGDRGAFRGRISNGTMDRMRRNHVISVDGQVLTLP